MAPQFAILFRFPEICAARLPDEICRFYIKFPQTKRTEQCCKGAEKINMRHLIKC